MDKVTEKKLPVRAAAKPPPAPVLNKDTHAVKRRTQLTKEDRYYIQQCAQRGNFDHDAISEEIEASVVAVYNYITRNSLFEIHTRQDFEDEPEIDIPEDMDLDTVERMLRKLYQREYWPSIKRQFSEEEVKTFIYGWLRTLLQFREDVLPTEEAQIRQLLTLQIFIDRSIQKRKEHNQEVERIQDVLNKEYKRENRNDDLLANLEQQVAFMRNSEGTYTKEYTALLDKYNKMSEGLKATRDQRIKHIQDSKTTWISYIHHLEDMDRRRRTGIDIEIQKKAHEHALSDLSQWHEYADGQVDQPILTSDTVLDEDGR